MEEAAFGYVYPKVQDHRGKKEKVTPNLDSWGKGEKKKGRELNHS